MAKGYSGQKWPSQKKAAFALLFLLLGVLPLGALQGCSKPAEPKFVLSGFTMGTGYNITVVGSDTPPEQLQGDIDTLLASINDIASTYQTDSELMRFNAAPINTPVEISETLFNMLWLSVEVAWLSGGALDVTIGNLVELWGFGADKSVNGKVPEDNAVAYAKERSGYINLQLILPETEGEPYSALKTKPIAIDLSAVAKGYAVDKVAQWLEYQGFERYLVEIGGELRLAGLSHRGESWRIAIERPDGRRGDIQQALSLTNTSMATSGDYHNYFEVDGRRYSHTLDPRTGRPITHSLASVTVIDPSAATADAMATALNVMGIERAFALATEEDIAAYFVVKSDSGFVVRYTQSFEEYLDK